MTSAFFFCANAIATTLAFCKNRQTDKVRRFRDNHRFARSFAPAIRFLNKHQIRNLRQSQRPADHRTFVDIPVSNGIWHGSCLGGRSISIHFSPAHVGAPGRNAKATSGNARAHHSGGSGDASGLEVAVGPS